MELIKVSEASRISKIPDSTIYNWVEEGRFKNFGEGKKILLDKIEFLKNIPTTICFYNKKGGSGKSTSSKILADYFEKMKIKTLIIDLDPQANITFSYLKYDDIFTGTGRDRKYTKPTFYNYLEDNTALNKIIIPYNDSIDIIPSDQRLDSKISIDTIVLRKYILDIKNIIGKYNIIIIDCPPSYNSLSRIGLLLANYIFCPVLAEKFSYDGIDEALGVLDDIKDYNKELIDFKVFLSKSEWQKTKIREFVESLYKNELENKYFDVSIPNFIGIVESQYERKNIFDYHSESVERIRDFCKQVEDFIYNKR